MMLVTALSPGDVMTLWTMRRSEYTNWGSLHFSASPLCVKKGNRRERGGVCSLDSHSSWAEGRFPNPPPPPLTFFWTQRSPGTEVAQNWHRPPGRCQGQPLCRGVAGANAGFVFRSHLTSWFGKGGWRIINQQSDAILHCMSTRNQTSG